MTGIQSLPQVALSTMSCAKSQEPLECLRLLERFGNPALELDFHLGEAALVAILTEVRSGNLQVLSVHNCNPKFVGTQQRYNTGLADLDEDSRRTAVADFVYSLELAAECGVGYCVGPLGRVQPAIEEEKSLRTLYRTAKESDRYSALQRLLVDERTKRVAPHMEAVKRSLDALAPICERLAVKFAPENRYEYGKLGTPQEIEHLKRLYPGVVGYCHDFGHAMSVDCLGLWPDPDPLMPSIDVDIWHINDFEVSTLVDHLPLGKGDLSLDAVRRAVCSGGAVAVVEVRANHPVEEVKQALALTSSWLDVASTGQA